MPAWAQNECGAPVAGAVTCTTPDPNNFPNGITYFYPATTLSLTVGNGLEITPNVGRDGVVITEVAREGLTQIIVQPGVNISTSGSQANGAEIFGGANSTLAIQFDGNMTGTFTTNDSPGSPTGAAVAIFDSTGNSFSSGDVRAAQGAGSVVNVNGPGANGIYVENRGAGAATAQAAGEITVAGPAAFGLNGRITTDYSVAALVVEQAAGSSITVNSTTGAGVIGTQAGLGALTVTTAGRVQVEGARSEGSVATVTNALGEGAVVHTIAATADIQVAGTNILNGVGAVRTSSTGLNATTTTVAGKITAGGSYTRGVDFFTLSRGGDAPHQILLTGGATIATSGDGAEGVFAASNGDGLLTIILEGSSSIRTTGIEASGVFVAPNGPSSVVTGDATEIFVTGTASNAIRTLQWGDEANDIEVNGRASSVGQDGAAIYALSGAGAVTVAIGRNGNIVGGWDDGTQPVSVSGNILPEPVASGISIMSGTNSRIENAGEISAATDRAIYDVGRIDLTPPIVGNVAVENRGLVTGYVELGYVAGNIFTNAAGGEFVTRHFADSQGDGTRDVKRVAKSDFGTQDSLFSNAGRVSLGAVTGATTTDAAGYYVPTTGADNRALDTSVYDLNRSDVVQTQFVNLSRFDHSGVLDLRGPEVGNSFVITSNAAAGGAAGIGIFEANGGQLLLSANLGAGIAAGGQTGNQADMLIVDGTSLGSAATQILVTQGANSLGAETLGNGIQLVEVRNKALSQAGVFTLGAPVAAGAYQYSLFHNGVGTDGADGNWYLRTGITDPDTDEEFPNYRPSVPVMTVVPALAQRLGLELLANHHDRKGADYADWLPRSAAQSGVPSDGHNGRKSAMWARVLGSDGDVGYRRDSVRQQAEGFARYGAAYDYETIAFQLGFDLLRSTNDKGARNVLGIYGGLGEIEAMVDAVYGGASGRVKLDGYNLGLYFTHKSAQGAYIDAVVQGTRFKSKAWDNSGYQSRTNGWGYAASLEAGVPLTLSEGWRLEPQAQIVYQRVELDDSTDAAALYDYQNSDALWGRLGLRMTSEWKRKSGLSNMVWARFNVWHDLGRDTETRVSNLGGQNATPLFTSLGGTWGQGQLALSSEMARNVSAFASADYSFSLDKMKSDAFGGRVGLTFVW